MNRKYRKRKLPKFFFIISLTLFLFIGIGYSVINSNLSMQGNVVRKATTWNIGFANPVFDTDSISSPTPTITNGTTMTMNVALANPGDKYAITVDLINTGSVPALINTLSITQLTSEQENYLRWKVEYEDESTPAVGDLLKAGETKKVHIYLEYKKLRATDLYPTSNVNLTLTITANFILPEETFNTVTITKNGSTKLIQVSNLEQEVTLTDFPIESTDQVIACNNGVEPSTDTNDKIVLSKVKQNATCRIEPSLASAITNSSTEVTNLAILQDATTDEKVSVGSTQNVRLNLNDKTYTMSSNDIETASIIINGTMKVYTHNTGSIITLTKRLFQVSSSATFYINGGTYTRIYDHTYGCTIRCGGVVDINNATIVSDRAATVATSLAGSIININNSTLYNTNDNYTVFVSNDNTLLSIKNSIISSTVNSAFEITNTNTTAYLCNNTITGTSNTDFHFSNEPKIYYSSNNVFKNGTNNPVSTPLNYKYLMKSEIACAE